MHFVKIFYKQNIIALLIVIITIQIISSITWSLIFRKTSNISFELFISLWLKQNRKSWTHRKYHNFVFVLLVTSSVELKRMHNQNFNLLTIWGFYVTWAWIDIAVESTLSRPLHSPFYMRWMVIFAYNSMAIWIEIDADIFFEEI